VTTGIGAVLGARLIFSSESSSSTEAIASRTLVMSGIDGSTTRILTASGSCFPPVTRPDSASGIIGGGPGSWVPS
jgi:hypothetical protein